MASSGTAGRRIAITGTGVVSPIGIGVDAFWQSLRDGRSGVDVVPELAGTVMPVQFGGRVADFDPKLYVKPRKSLKVMSREIQIGFAAADMAMQQSGLQREQVSVDRFGVVYGCEMLYCDVEELKDVFRYCWDGSIFDFARWDSRAMGEMFPLWMLKYLPNMVACHIGIAHDARGPNNTITLGDASSLLALIEAVRVIQRDQADVMIAGGAGSRLSLTPLMYRQDLRCSHRGDAPAAASRPFDAQRDGMVIGEGAGAVVLESYEHAQARGAKVLAEIAGCGLAYDHPAGSAQEGIGIQHAIRQALEEAQLTAAQVDHVNAHGLSTIEDDAREAQAIRAQLGDVPVTALKSFFGNLGAGSGVVELIGSVLAYAQQQVPYTLNYEHPDSACPVEVIRNQMKPLEREAAVVLNHSSTGQTAAVVLRSI